MLQDVTRSYKIPKKGKELSITTHNKYTITFGSVNNKVPRAIYLNILSWGEPNTEDNVAYSRIIKSLHKNIKQTLYDYLSSRVTMSFIPARSIVDLDIRESGVRFGKKSFTKCEITLFLKSEISVLSDEMRDEITSIVNHLIKKSYESNKYLRFSKRK